MPTIPLPLNYGKDRNYFNRLTITSTTFAIIPDVIIPFQGNPSFSIINEGANTIEYSFNGNTKHGDLVPSTPSAAEAFNHRGISQIWFRVLAGTSVVRLESFAEGEFAGIGGSGGGGGGGGTVTQGPAASLGGAWPVEITDGTHGPAAVKASSTPAASTDQALVVAISPNAVVVVSGTVNQGTPGSVANGWPAKITDGTNVAAVKPSTTAAATVDSSLVVAFSPNSPLPAGTNSIGSVTIGGGATLSQNASIATVSAVLKASAGHLNSVYAANRSAVNLWLQFINSTAAITTGNTAVLQFSIPPGGQIVIGSDFFSTNGWVFTTGISWGISTQTTTYAAYGTPANTDAQFTYL